MHRSSLILFSSSVLATPMLAQQSALQLVNVNAGTSGYVRVADSVGLEPQQLTLELWVRPGGAGWGGSGDSAGGALVGKSREGAGGNYLTPYYLGWSASTNRIHGRIATNIPNQGAFVNSISPVPPGTSRHVAMTFDGALLSLYIDGVLERQVTAPASSLDYGAEDLLIGASRFCCGFQRQFDGVVDEIRLWDHARDAATIAMNRFCTLSGVQPGLLAYWKFDGDTLVDWTGNGHDGVLEGTHGGTVPAPLELGTSCQPLGVSYCAAATPNSTGLPGRIEAWGSSDVTLNQVVLTTRSLPFHEFGFMLISQTSDSVMPPGSNGFLCLGGQIGRMNQTGRIFQGPNGHVSLDLTFIPVNPPAMILPGETWRFQAWHRDGSSSNFTDAIAIPFM